jgi:hypothetical protein
VSAAKALERIDAEYLEEWFETLGRFGVAGRLAIPRLSEFRNHPNPWVRMWAGEALTRIVAKDSSTTVPSRSTDSAPAPPQQRN